MKKAKIYRIFYYFTGTKNPWVLGPDLPKSALIEIDRAWYSLNPLGLRHSIHFTFFKGRVRQFFAYKTFYNIAYIFKIAKDLELFYIFKLRMKSKILFIVISILPLKVHKGSQPRLTDVSEFV